MRRVRGSQRILIDEGIGGVVVRRDSKEAVPWGVRLKLGRRVRSILKRSGDDWVLVDSGVPENIVHGSNK